MRINLTMVLHTHRGEPFKSGDGSPLTLFDVFYGSLSGYYPQHETIAGPEKLERDSLGERMVKSNGDFEITVEELELIRRLAGYNCGSFVFGAINRAINQVLAGGPRAPLPVSPKAVN